MKILYSHRTQSADGQWVHIEGLTSALRSRGHEITMAGPAGDESRSLSAGGGGKGMKSFLPAPLYELAEFAYSTKGYVRLARLAEMARPDVIYERYNLHYFAGAWLKRRANLPLILEVNSPLAEERAAHGDLALKGFARRNEERIWRAADMVLPVTGVLADKIRAAGVPDERILVIQNGVEKPFLGEVNDQEVRTRHKLEGKLILGFSGFVRDWHGVDRAIRYLARLGREDVHLLVVGDGPARDDLEALAVELGVANQVTITGVVQREDMPQHVAAFDIALQPAVVDYASPLKLFEYMALGKPVIAPDAPNILEVLSDGDNGLLFRGDGFDAALDVLVKDADLRLQIGRRAKETILSDDYTWDGNARRVESVAERLTGEKHDHQN